ncbi:MAG: UvrB/UvrC motif-containing protein, partial [Schleiferiaceae bacterium]|nr:UvrB/UvrC motif-containing protein [Schleiferiaceae bacterium]
YELTLSGGVYAEQVIRPTGLLDPIVEVRPTENQVDDLMDEIRKRTEIDERTLVTTLTKRMAEELTKYLTRYDIRCRYIHSDVDTMERVEIMRDLRLGVFDVLIGVNLLREGLDFPEVSLVAILDADKEGFLRSERSLVQTIGRAARNVNGRAILYADKITNSMRATMEETERRREKQDAFNKANGMEPQALKTSKAEILAKSGAVSRNMDYEISRDQQKSTERATNYFTPEDLESEIRSTRKAMEAASKSLDFIEAARLRNELIELEGKREKR